MKEKSRPSIALCLSPYSQRTSLIASFPINYVNEKTPKKGIYLYTPISRSPRIGLTSIKCAVDAPYEGNIPKFPRMNVWDPYKRLGISPYASEEEIWSSRNFLLQQYAGNETSEESIEAAFEKLLMTSYRERKKTKINLKTRLKKKVEESPTWVKNLLNFVELPPMEVIFRRLFLFAFMGGWSIMNSAEGGPAFQVAVSLAACIYFLNEKTKSLGRAFIIGESSFLVTLGTSTDLVGISPDAVYCFVMLNNKLTANGLEHLQLGGYVVLYVSPLFQQS
ncbi:hypothetical protein OIU77_000692 [Salix suchowensis]|uniref:Uncharacterized protein n=1 Tax=Salix suchowensis TaxID=1278906 RepID=A0ABQ9B9G4_9ROSI|nr:hypothetical protein OIU77_000692 [Salix suchowensis]